MAMDSAKRSGCFVVGEERGAMEPRSVPRRDAEQHRVERLVGIARLQHTARELADGLLARELQGERLAREDQLAREGQLGQEAMHEDAEVPGEIGGAEHRAASRPA